MGRPAVWLFSLATALLPSVAGAAANGSRAACDPRLPYALGGCALRSPYTGEARAGVAGFGTNGPPAHRIVSGWIQILNTGPAMPHLVLRVQNRGTFTASRIRAEVNTGSRRYSRWVTWRGPRHAPYLWDFGSLPSGAVATVRFRMTLVRSCSYTMDYQGFGRIDLHGQPDERFAIWDVGGGYSGGLGSCGAP